jgi:hypothetical protein
MVELVYTLVLETSASRLVGSTPTWRTHGEVSEGSTPSLSAHVALVVWRPHPAVTRRSKVRFLGVTLLRTERPIQLLAVGSCERRA